MTISYLRSTSAAVGRNSTMQRQFMNTFLLKSSTTALGRSYCDNVRLGKIASFVTIDNLTNPNPYPRRRFQSTTASEMTSTTNTNTTSHPSVTLYQYAICPFCNIAKSVLHYHRIPYDAKEVNPLTKAELDSLPTKDYRKVPIMTIQIVHRQDDSKDDEVFDPIQQINGSEEIVDEILSLADNQNGDKNNIQQQQQLDTSSESSQKWTEFAREDLAPLLYPNLCNTLGNSVAAFNYVHHPSSQFTTLQKYSIQYIGSVAMYMAASRIKKKRNITDERQALYDALQTLEDEISQAGGERGTDSFLSMSPTQPHMGDLTVYGVLRSLQGLPIHEQVMTDFPAVSSWYKKLQEVVEK